MITKAKNFVRVLRRSLASFHPRRWLKQLWHSPRLLGDRYTLEDHTLVTVFTDQPELFPNYRPIRPLTSSPRQRRVTVSVIATARNERTAAPALMASL